MDCTMKRKSKFVIHIGKDGKYYTRLISPSGNVLLSTSGMVNKENTILLIYQILRYGIILKNYVRKETQNSLKFFQLKTPSGRILAWSECTHTDGQRNTLIDTTIKAMDFRSISEIE